MPAGLLEFSSTPSNQTTTRATQFTSDTSTGALSSQTIEPNGDESTFELTTYQVDPHGVVSGFVSQDKSGLQKRTLSLRFDSEDLYPTILTNALGQSEEFAIHPAFGVLAVHQDSNGVLRQFQYDGFGRFKHLAAPDGDDVFSTYRASPFYEIDTRRATGQFADTNYDAFLNEVEHDSTGFDGTPIAIVTNYNAQGLISERDGPCYKTISNCASAGSEKYTYDELGRRIGTIHGDGSRRKKTYLGLKITDFDELQNQHYLVQDQLGRVARSVRVVDKGREVPIIFNYEPFGLIQTVTDAYGNVVSAAYDVRGRQITLNDPDSGNHSYEWSAFGDLAAEQNGNIHIQYQRDTLGRIEAVKDTDGTATFCWDAALHGIGKISNTRSTDGITTAYLYDSKARISTATWTVGHSKYRFGLSYDSYGRLDTISYPLVGHSPFTVKEKYNQFGFLQQVINARTSSVYWQVDAQNERGEIRKEEFGNGLITQRDYDTQGRITGIQTTGKGVIEQRISYSYFPTGSLQCRSNELPSLTVVEQFLYDPFDRLKYWRAGTVNNGLSPCPVVETPTKLMEQVFSYDDIGNLKQRSTTLGAGPNLTYQYGQNQAGPHAVTQVNSASYGYDAHGDQTSGPGRAVRYTVFNLPSHLKEKGKTSSFKYDASHARVAKGTGWGRTTTYVAGLYEKRNRWLRTTQVFSVQGSERVVAQVRRTKRNSPDSVVFLHDDHLSSIQTVTDNTGTSREHVWYEPFGQTVSPSNPGVIIPSRSSVDLGFTGQTDDSDLALINMKGRIYDPKIGKFLTPDPFIQDPLDSESLNRYSYAWNNPLKWVDPSGFQDEGGGGGGDVDAGSEEQDYSMASYPIRTPLAPACGPGGPDESVSSSQASDIGVSQSIMTPRSLGQIPPPLVQASDPGAYSCCAAVSQPSKGWLQNFLHAVGLAPTEEDRVREARQGLSIPGQTIYIEGKAVDPSKMSDQEVLDAWKQFNEAWRAAGPRPLAVLAQAALPALYRGGSSLQVRTIDIKTDPTTGLLRPGRGLSVNTDPSGLGKFGGAYKIDEASVPSELEIIQRGQDPNHYEIAPREPMTLEHFQELLNQIKLDQVNPR